MPEGPTDLGRYKLIRRLALGGMAEVFLAQVAGPAGFSKTVVVKRIHPHLAQDESLVEMFLNEARLAAELNHPNIVQIFELGEADGSYFIAMEYIDGVNLRTMNRGAVKEKSPLPIDVVVKIVVLACEGLAYAHDFADPNTGNPLNLVHRDISSDNILLSLQGAVKVVDFGIAKAQAVGMGTNSGMVKGKLPYMPPEQLRAHPLDRRADVYALGVVLYELLAGERPFQASVDVELMQLILKQPPPPLQARRPDAPPALCEIAARLLSKKREDRYPDCQALQSALEKVLVAMGSSAGTRELSELAHKYAPTKSNPNLVSPNPAEKEPSGPKESMSTKMVPISPATLGSERTQTGASRERAKRGSFSVALEGTAEDVLIRLMVRYGDRELPVEQHPMDLAVLNEGGQRVLVYRNVESELGAVQKVEALGLRYKPLMGRFSAVGEAAIGVWARASELFPAGWTVTQPQRARVTLKPPVQATVKVQRGGAGYRVDIAVASEGTAVDLDTMRAAARASRHYLRIREGEYAEIDPKLEQLDEVLTELGQTKAAFEIPMYEIANVARLIDAAAKAEGTSNVELFLGQMSRTTTPPPVEIAPEFTGTLRPYQRTAYHWLELLRANGLHGVLADDTGLGKKVTALAALLNEARASDDPHLVVCPTAALAQWEQEVRHFAPTLAVSRERPSGPKSLWLLDWEKVQAERERLTARFAYLVLDEAHLLREVPPDHVASLSRISAQRRLALTSLPLEARLLTLWSVFDFLLPGFLGTEQSFQATYVDPIDRDGDEEARARLRSRVQPFLMRRLKREVLTEVPTNIRAPRA